MRVLEIIKMNGNKKLIKNFPNCFQVSLMGNRQPSLFPAPKSGGSTRLGAGQDGPRNSSGQVFLGLPELFRKRPRRSPASPPAVYGSVDSAARLRTLGRWVGSRGPALPYPRQGARFATEKHPPTRRRPRGSSQRPKSVSRSQTTAVWAVCAAPRATRSLERSR